VLNADNEPNILLVIKTLPDAHKFIRFKPGQPVPSNELEKHANDMINWIAMAIKQHPEAMKANFSSPFGPQTPGTAEDKKKLTPYLKGMYSFKVNRIALPLFA